MSLDRILQSEDAGAEDAGQALQKLALLDSVAISLDLISTDEKKAVSLLQEQSLVAVDDQNLASMHALTQLVVRDVLTEKAQRASLLATLAGVLARKMEKINSGKPATYFVGRRYASHGVAIVGHVRSSGLLPAHVCRATCAHGENVRQQDSTGRMADSSWKSVALARIFCLLSSIPPSTPPTHRHGEV